MGHLAGWIGLRAILFWRQGDRAAESAARLRSFPNLLCTGHGDGGGATWFSGRKLE